MQTMSRPRVFLDCAVVAISACHTQTASDHASRAQAYDDQEHYREAIVELADFEGAAEARRRSGRSAPDAHS
jgi:hypothetical protein